MQKRFKPTDLKILEGLGTYGPRNITRLARKLDMPTEKVRRRIKRLQSRNMLWLKANIYHTNLGLRKAVLFAEATPGNEKLLSDCMKANDFWIYTTRCYGRFDGSYGVYTIPVDHDRDFETFVAKLSELGIAKTTQIFWSTCFQKVNPTTNWFDQKSQSWIFPWETWVGQMSKEGTTLPYTLQDPKEFPMKGDYMDVFILKEMEIDATIDLSEIARMLKTSPQLVKYHYDEHVVKQGLLENFEIEFLPYEESTSDHYIFTFEFPNKDKMAKTTCSLLNKPFVCVVGKILGQTGMISQFYLPRKEFKNFKDSLDVLIRKGFLKGYNYVIQYQGEWSRQTISFEYFEKKKWIYNHEKHIKALEKAAKALA